MRVLRLDLADGPVQLHPFVTVVRGIAPARREELLAALAALPAGRAAVPGLVEAHGVLLDLTAETLDLLELAAGVDVVVRAEDLPGGGAGGDHRIVEARQALTDGEAALAAAADAVEQARRAADGAAEALAAVRSGGPGDDPTTEGLAGSREELDRRSRAAVAAERALADAVAVEQAAARAVIDAEAAAEATGRARADATRAVSVAAAALEAATDRRDPMAAAALEAAVARLAEAEAAVAAANEGAEREPAAGTPLSDDEMAALRAERLEAEAGVLALDTPDPFPVRLAVDQLQAGGGAEPVPDPRAQALADQLAEVGAALDRISVADVPGDDLEGGDAHAAARARLAAAEAAVAAAEGALRRPEADPAAVAALEAAHDELLDARDAADRRFRRRDPAARIAAAEAAERAALDALGFDTWADFLMGTRGDLDLSAPMRLEQARTELAGAAAAVKAIDAAGANELRRAQLLDRRRELRAIAVELLGEEPDDLADALRRRRIPATETGAHLTRLRSALEATGLVLGGEDLPERTLVDLAKVWLEEIEHAAAERLALEARVADLDARLAEATRSLREAAARQSDGTPTLPPLAAALAAADEARSAVDAARARLAHHEHAEAEIELRRGAFEHAAADEQVAVASVADAEAALIGARAAERDAAGAVLEAEMALDATKVAERAAASVLASLEERLGGVAVDRVAALESDVAAATDRLAEVTAEYERRAAAVEAARAAVESAEKRAAVEGDEPDPAADAEDAEWFLLARLAGQRAVSFAGSVPLVLDDALAAFDAELSRRLLARLERMAATVQVVVVTEDLVAAAWAESLGPERAAVS